MLKISAERLKEVWNGPACVGVNIGRNGSRCAAGKINALFGDKYDQWRSLSFVHGLSGSLPNVIQNAITVNNSHFDNQDEAGSYRDLGKHPDGYAEEYGKAFGPEHPQWQRHIRAFKIMLQELINAGLIGLDDEAAAEFEQVKQVTLVA